jgi:hypothetical protein
MERHREPIPGVPAEVRRCTRRTTGPPNVPGIQVNVHSMSSFRPWKATRSTAGDRQTEDRKRHSAIASMQPRLERIELQT